MHPIIVSQLARTRIADAHRHAVTDRFAHTTRRRRRSGRGPAA